MNEKRNQIITYARDDSKKKNEIPLNIKKLKKKTLCRE